MKRILSLMLVFVFSFTLAACASTEEAPAEPAETTETTEAPAETPAEEATEETGDLPFAGKTLKVAGLDGGYGTERLDESYRRI